MQSGIREIGSDRGSCTSCGHGEFLPGQKLCAACLEATTQFSCAVGVCASPFLIRRSGALPEGGEQVVRIHIGDYAYEVTKVLCPGAEDFARWAYNVYEARSNGAPLAHYEDSPSQEHAERNARQVIALYIELDRVRSREPGKYKRARR